MKFPHEYGIDLNVVQLYLQSWIDLHKTLFCRSVSCESALSPFAAKPNASPRRPRPQRDNSHGRSPFSTTCSPARGRENRGDRSQQRPLPPVVNSPRPPAGIEPDLPQLLQLLQHHLQRWHLYHAMRTAGKNFQVDENLLPTGGGALSPHLAGLSGGQARLAETMKRAYWDLCFEKLCEQKDFTYVVEKLEEAVDRMAKYFDRSPSRRANFLKMLDIGMVKQMVAKNAYDVDAFSQTLESLTQMLEQLESPFQAARTKEFFSKPTSFITADIRSGAGRAAEVGGSGSHQQRLASAGVEFLETWRKRRGHRLERGDEGAQEQEQLFAANVVASLQYVFRKLDILTRGQKKKKNSEHLASACTYYVCRDPSTLCLSI